MADLNASPTLRGSVHQSLTASTSTGAGSSIDLIGVYTAFAVQLTTGGATGTSVQLQGRLNPAAPWTSIGSAYTSTAGAIAQSTGAAREVRLNVTATSTGSGVSGWIGVTR